MTVIFLLLSLQPLVFNMRFVVAITEDIQQKAQTRQSSHCPTLCMVIGVTCLQVTYQKKLKWNSSFDGVKTKADVSSWVCDFWTVSWASGCSRFSSAAAVWVLTSALRWKTLFFGEHDTTLTRADAISVRMGKICQLAALWPHWKAPSLDRLFYT